MDALGILDALDDDSDGDVDNIVEIETRTKSMMIVAVDGGTEVGFDADQVDIQDAAKPEDGTAFRSEATIAVGNDEKKEKRSRRGRRSRSKSRSKKPSDLAPSASILTIDDRPKKGRRTRSRDPEAEERKRLRFEKYDKDGLTPEEMEKEEAKRRQRARSKSRQRKETQLEGKLNIDLERSASKVEPDDDRVKRKDDERKKRREKRERSKTRKNETMKSGPEIPIDAVDPEIGEHEIAPDQEANTSPVDEIIDQVMANDELETSVIENPNTAIDITPAPVVIDEPTVITDEPIIPTTETPIEVEESIVEPAVEPEAAPGWGTPATPDAAPGWGAPPIPGLGAPPIPGVGEATAPGWGAPAEPEAAPGWGTPAESEAAPGWGTPATPDAAPGWGSPPIPGLGAPVIPGLGDGAAPGWGSPAMPEAGDENKASEEAAPGWGSPVVTDPSATDGTVQNNGEENKADDDKPSIPRPPPPPPPPGVDPTEWAQIHGTDESAATDTPAEPTDPTLTGEETDKKDPEELDAPVDLERSKQPFDPNMDFTFDSDQEMRSLDGRDTFANADDNDVSEALTSRLNEDNLRDFDKLSVPTMSRASSILSLAIEEPEREKKKRFGLFGRHKESNQRKKERPSRLADIYHAVRKGLGDYISINTAELNVLQTQRLNQPSPGPELVETCTELQTLLVRLQDQQEHIDNLYESYNDIDKEWREEKIKQPTSEMLQYESEMQGYLGEFFVNMKGLLGFSRLKAGDQYEVTLRYGKGQKWKSQGHIEKMGFELKQTWSETETTFRPLIAEFIAIKVTEARKIGKGTVVGNVSCETKGNV